MMRFDGSEIAQSIERDRRLRRGGGDRTRVMTAAVIWCAVVAAPVLVWLLSRSGGYKRQPDARPNGPGLGADGGAIRGPDERGVAGGVALRPHGGARLCAGGLTAPSRTVWSV